MKHPFDVRPGDIVLVPKETTPGIYTFVEERFGKIFAKALAQLYGHNYIHAEVVVGNDFQMGAWPNGVKIWKVPLNYYTLVHIYRLKPEYKKVITKEEMIQAVQKYFNKEYDFPSLLLNTIITLLSFGNDSLERKFEIDFTYSNPDKLICSELVARIYEELGFTIERNAEYTTPDDIAQSQLFYRVL